MTERRRNRTNFPQHSQLTNNTRSDSALSVQIKEEILSLRVTRDSLSDKIFSLGKPPAKLERGKKSDDRDPINPSDRAAKPSTNSKEDARDGSRAIRKRERVSPMDELENKRSRRLFGNVILGTLRKSREALETEKERETKREDLRKEAEDKQVERSNEIFKDAYAKYWEEKERMILEQCDVDAEMKMKQKKLYESIARDCESEIANGKIRTDAMPRVFWKPSKETIQTQSILARQPGKVNEWLKAKLVECEDYLVKIENRREKVSEDREKRLNGGGVDNEDVVVEEPMIEEEDLNDADADADAAAMMQ